MHSKLDSMNEAERTVLNRQRAPSTHAVSLLLSTFFSPHAFSTEHTGPEVLDERLLRGVFDSYRSCYVHECGDSFLGGLGNTVQLARGGVHFPGVGD